MDCDDLINFNNDSSTEIRSPLIPTNTITVSISSDTNNIVEKVFNPISQECDEEKENINLLSPFVTPKVNRKQLKISTTPLFLSENSSEQKVVRKDLDKLIDLNNTKFSDQNNSSLQFFDDSFLNGTLNCALLASNIEDKLLSFEKDVPKKSVPSFSSFSTESFMNNNELSKISSTNSVFANNVLDKAFLDSKTDNFVSQPFRRRCLSASKPQKPIQNYNFTARRQLNNSFGGFNTDFLIDQNIVLEELKKICDDSNIETALDVEKSIESMEPPWLEDISILSEDENICKEILSEQKKPQINEFDYLPSPKIIRKKILPTLQTKTSEKLEKSSRNENITSENLSLKQKIENENRSSDENISPINSSPEISSPKKNDMNESFTLSIHKDLSFEINGNDVKLIKSNENDNTENVNNLIQNIKDMLHKESKGEQKDRRKLGESLLNAFAIALNLDDLIKHDNSHDSETLKSHNTKTNQKDSDKKQDNYYRDSEKVNSSYYRDSSHIDYRDSENVNFHSPTAKRQDCYRDSQNFNSSYSRDVEYTDYRDSEKVNSRHQEDYHDSAQADLHDSATNKRHNIKIECDSDKSNSRDSDSTKVKPKKIFKLKDRFSFTKNSEPKMKIQPVKAQDKFLLKNMKLKNEEKTGKGPLKAIIPVKNMEKTRKSLLKSSIGFTPPKILQENKTSTPLWPVSRKPQAHSTPNASKPIIPSNNSLTPKKYLQSSLPRPLSVNDLNRSISPRDISKNSTGSVPNLSTSNNSVNRSIPKPNMSMLRRKSASDLKYNNNINKSCEEIKEKPSKLKRSFSFQNKSGK